MEYPELKCGAGSILYPMAPHYDNAFNPCFLTTSFTLVAVIFLAYGTITYKKLLKKHRFGGFSSKSTGWRRSYLLPAALLLEIMLFAYITSFVSVHERFADQKIIAFGLLNILLIFIIFPLEVMETSYSPIQLSVLLIFWPLFTMLLLALYFQDNFTDWAIIKSVRSIKFTESLLIINSIFIFIMEYYMWEPSQELIMHYRSTGQEEKLTEPNIIQQITFTWMNDLIVNSYKNKTVTSTELPNSPQEVSIVYSAKKLGQYWHGGNLITSLLKAFGTGLLVSFAYELGGKLLNFVKPQLLRLLILYFDIKNPPFLEGLLICFAIFASSIIQTSLNNKYMLKNLENGLSVRSSLTSLIYQKALVLSSESRLKVSSGDIINLLSVDINRVQRVLLNLSTLVLAPFDLVLCVVSLWPLLGSSTLAGIAVMVILIPVNAILVRYTRRLNKKQMKLKDSRTRIINEILTSIKSVKLYAWEKPMLHKLFEARNNKELKNMLKIKMLNLVSNLVWYMIPVLVSLMSFGCFALTQETPLTSDIVFPALTLLGLLSAPLYELPAVITSIIEAQVAIGRIRDFLTSEELDESLIKRLPKLVSGAKDDKMVEISNASFYWTRKSYVDEEEEEEEVEEEVEEEEERGHQADAHQLHALKNIDFSVNKGDLSCIVGKVGSGKTSLLYALLGQMVVTKGKRAEPPNICIRGSIAYCAQTPWIMNASVKENIQFGCRFDADFYNKTIDACQLSQDLEALPDGDDTQVGEKGISLSGGQKARLALARAVYSRADIYLLDDILSAVDSHVGKKIIDQVLSKSGLLGSKTVILCTNSISVLKYSDHVTLIDAGTVVETTTYQDVGELQHPKLFYWIKNFSKDTKDFDSDILSPPTASILSSKSFSSAEENKSVVVADDSETKSLRRASIETFQWDPLAKLLPNLRSGQSQEESQKGKVKWSVYIAYFKACSVVGIVIWLSVLVVSNILSIAGNYWLKYWTEENSKYGTNKNVWRFLSIYAALQVGSTLLSIVRSAIMTLWLGLNASRRIHDNMAKRVLAAPMEFFERTPVGRIMNRFTNDINKIDDGIPFVFQGFVSQITKTVFTLIVVSIAIPAYAIVISILSAIYIYYEIYYVSISRELKRLVSVSRSPIYAHLGESLNGIDTIRAYNQKDRFGFIMNKVVDFNLKSQYMLTSINRWLNFRLQVVGGLGVLSASLMSVMSLRTLHPLSASMVGFVMTYALQVTGSLKVAVRMSAEVETSIVAAERCLEYTQLEVEEEEGAGAAANKSCLIPPINWPSKGRIEFVNYSTRYRKNLDCVLKRINMTVQKGEKVGVVGRTGAGKSTLALALFRIIEAVEGNIFIDDINTSAISLYDLRHNLSIIPQDSQLFEGTVRQNLDPFDYYTDEELWDALELAHLKGHILKMRNEGPDDRPTKDEGGGEGGGGGEGESDDRAENKLLSKVYEGGSNFSSGQRQLMSLARVLLRMKHSQILVLDEATAAVDVETDKIIQETIRKQFQDKTIITIAHRLETVMDSDKIAGLDKGELQEYDTPQNLLASRKGVFYTLCKQGGYITGET